MLLDSLPSDRNAVVNPTWSKAVFRLTRNEPHELVGNSKPR